MDIKLVEVSPRDGLQHELVFIDTQNKIQFIDLLAATGLVHIEVSSFVSPHAIPQLRDARELFPLLKPQPNVTYSALVPNRQGFDDALHAQVQEIAVFGAVSETFSQHNINCSVDESLQHFADVINAAKEHNIPVRGYISCTLNCPYEGDMSPKLSAQYAKQLYDLGCYEIALGDTTGKATPKRVIELIDCVTTQVPREALAMHFHDTYGQAIANVYASLENDIRTFDCSVSGLGGCPYAKSAAGNIATEEMVYLLDGLGLSTGVDLDKLIIASNFIDKLLNRTTQSRVKQAYANK